MRSFTIVDILRRRSCHEFGDDPVAPDAIETMIRAAMSGNDHGQLQPWEFRVFMGQGRAQLAAAFVQHAIAEGEELQRHKKAETAPFRAPVVICVSTVRRECKIPFRDQLFSAVSACQLITLTAHLLGLAAVWKTGAWATSSIVRESLGIKRDDEIVGFIYVGTRAGPDASARCFPTDKVFINSSLAAR
ncbi:nitroreductase family protein [Burkholderia ambifaria]|uniref:nitroreductase family protein n=1 Tax=Burkholderia ambifaria TaxID=152480 RepID=UPI00158CA003|nr:nitroreductase [Burkholderia ambifaria]WDR97985.1 nitroreductase [Burkholderia ambifaria]